MTTTKGGLYWLNRLKKPLVILLFVVVLSIVRPSSFLSTENISNVLWSISTIGIMTAGTIFVILLGGIDLSVGSMMAFSGAICVKIIVAGGNTTFSAFLGILAGLLCGGAVGLIHGFVINKFKVPAFLITFASQIILSGVAQLILDNKIINVQSPALFTGLGSQKILGFPLPIYFMAVIMLLSHYALSRTKTGRYTYAVGGNPTAAKLSGVNTTKITILAYVLSGLTAAFAGIILSSMTQQAMASAGSGYDTEVITAIVIGGASLMGGEGTMGGSFFGVILVGLLGNAMNLLELPATVHPLVKGIVIIVAVAFDTVGKDKDTKKQFFSLFRKKKRA